MLHKNSYKTSSKLILNLKVTACIEHCFIDVIKLISVQPRVAFNLLDSSVARGL